MAWGSAIVYWKQNPGDGVWAQGPPSLFPGNKDFAGTYAVVNGALECPEATTGDARVTDRISYFKKAAAALGFGVDGWILNQCPGKNLCGGTWATATNCSKRCNSLDSECEYETTGQKCFANATMSRCGRS